MNLPEGIKERCICGAEWAHVEETEWGLKIKCERRHTLHWRARPTPRQKPVMLVGGHRVLTGPQEERPAPPMSRGLRLRLWWWRKRREIGESFAAAGRTRNFE